MELIAYIILGILIGGVVVWLLAKARFQGLYAKQTGDLQVSHSNQITELEKRASGAEARVEELRQQVDQRDSEISQIRSELDVEKQSKIEALTRLEETQKNLKEEIERFEAMEKKLSETFKALSLDALAKNTDEFKKYADEFIKLAAEKLRSQTVEGTKELEGKKNLHRESHE